eukprot:m.140798 g.140798  ORF g.140798 m.140798 type:complete len:50 (-) comp22825_c0_seq1:238-387(-)
MQEEGLNFRSDEGGWMDTTACDIVVSLVGRCVKAIHTMESRRTSCSGWV